MRKELTLNIRPISKKEISVRFGAVRGYYSKKYVEYQKSLFALIKSQIGPEEFNKDDLISIYVEFYKDKIKLIIETIDENEKSKYYDKRPDIDNLLKPVLDELKYAIKIDDSKYVKVVASKLNS